MLSQQIQQPRVIEYSPLQYEFMMNCNSDPILDHRWYGKIGATRSGKTTLDYMWTIPFRLQCRKGLQGLNCITGVSLGTIGRNILEPMRNYWAKLGFPKVVSETKKDRDGNNYVTIFGEKVFLIGMEKVNAVSKLRGAEFKYCYCDELAECNESAFILLKSRLSLAYSCCDFTCNPESDTHWLYAFITDETIDIYIQNYTLFDNPFLSQKFIDDLCKEYSGTVFYDRYILGLWKKAEGLVYKMLADNPEQYILNKVPQISRITCGVDYGGNKSAHSFTCVGWGPNNNYIVVLESVRLEGYMVDANELCDKFEEFVEMVKNKYNFDSFECYCDSADQIMINSFKNLSAHKRLGVIVKDAIKNEIKERIRLITRLIGTHRIYWMVWAKTSLNAMSSCVYDSREGHEEERLDNLSTDIDSVDSTEYAIEPFMRDMLRVIEMRGIYDGSFIHAAMNRPTLKGARL